MLNIKHTAKGWDKLEDSSEETWGWLKLFQCMLKIKTENEQYSGYC